MCLFFCFFFFKQKTAYEMRISDWSSDVCSSDLTFPSSRPASSYASASTAAEAAPAADSAGNLWPRGAPPIGLNSRRPAATQAALAPVRYLYLIVTFLFLVVFVTFTVANRQAVAIDFRSAEQTSELQSLMRLSYAI